jgi:hypothetical protein
MLLTDLKQRIKDKEPEIKENLLTWILKDEINGKQLSVGLTPLLMKNCKKGKVWNSKEFLITLKNFKYGFNETKKRSRGGYDGVFMMDRKFRPYNSMQRKLFEKFIDKPGSEFNGIIEFMDIREEDVVPIRLVSHHMRLLGILHQANKDMLVLVDFDREKGK